MTGQNDRVEAERPGAATLVLRIIRMMEERGRVGIGEISRELAVSRSAAHRAARTLVDEGFLMLSGTGRGYGPGPALVAFGAVSAVEMDVHRRWGGVLRAARDATGESVHSAVLIGSQVLVTDGRRSSFEEDMGSRIGMTAPANAMAAGKLLLAALDERLVRAVVPEGAFAKRTPRTVADMGTLLSELADVRRDGAAYTVQESEPGIDSVAVPLDGRSFRDRAALVVSVPSERGGRLRLRRLKEAAARAVAEHAATGVVSPWAFPRGSRSRTRREEG